MKKSALFPLLLAAVLVSSNQLSFAAIAKMDNAAPVYREPYRTTKSESGRFFKKEKKQLKKSERRKARIHKLLRKSAGASAQIIHSQYLKICLVLFLVAIVFFALPGAVFNIFGSVTAIVAAIFFVFWLLELKGSVKNESRNSEM